MIKVTKDNFINEVLESETKVLVDFNADWCGPCKMLKPILEEVEKKVDKVKIVSVNIDEEEELSEKYNVTSIPCLILFNGKEEIKRSIGLIPLEQIMEMLGEE